MCRVCAVVWRKDKKMRSMEESGGGDKGMRRMEEMNRPQDMVVILGSLATAPPQRSVLYVVTHRIDKQVVAGVVGDHWLRPHRARYIGSAANAHNSAQQQQKNSHFHFVCKHGGVSIFAPKFRLSYFLI